MTSQAENGPAPPVADDPKKDVNVTPALNIPEGGSYREEKIEYRDEAGNLLDPEAVKSMEGSVSFSTRYETSTRLVDQFGNELGEGAGEGEGYAGTSADGVDPGTANAKAEGKGSPRPPKVAVKDDLSKEAKVDDAPATPEPEMDALKQTGRDEL